MFPILEKLSKGGNASRFVETAIPFCERRRLFLTVNGFLGMGPDCIREGDILCILSVWGLPFILRPVEPKTQTPSDTVIEIPGARPVAEKQFRLVGECYVEGLMQGETISALNQEKESRWPIPTDLIVQEIVTRSDTPEPYEETDFKTIGELNNLRQKNEKFEKGWLAKSENFEQGTQSWVEKNWFHIL